MSQVVRGLAVKELGRRIFRVMGSTRIQSLLAETHSRPSWSTISNTRCMWAPRTPFSQVVTVSTSLALGHRWMRMAIREIRKISRLAYRISWVSPRAS